MSRRALPLALALLLALAAGGAPAGERTEERTPCRVRDPLRRPWFGDLHVHTRHSLDASTQGTRTSPREAYRFARGERIGLHPFAADGRPLRSAQLTRPLDFAAVTDHAEFFGETWICNQPGLAGHDSLVCRVYRHWPRLAFFFMSSRGLPRFSLCGDGGEGCAEAARSPWRELREAAEEAYDRSDACRFTSFVGYEWTRAEQTVANLHRNVIFRNADVPDLPADALDFPTPEALWSQLDRTCREAGRSCDALVIPHNSNLSAGLMFAPERSDGRPFDADYARRRAAYEPLVEVMQHKGASECRPGAGTEDELCDFELLPYADFGGRFLRLGGAPPVPPPLSYARNALGAGLVHGQRLGANPFAFGLIGSTDTHLGTPGLVDPEGYPGHGGAGVPVGVTVPDQLLDPPEYNPGGLAVVWAEENSRDALFEALRRRETYATSGPRITLRLFAGDELPDDLCERHAFAETGYARGVPMGGTLPPGTTAPALAVQALRDPGSAGRPGLPLQRLQLVKLWVVDGEVREHVVDVAGDPASGAEVDLATCEPRGEGFDRLCAVWRDPDFDVRAPALYYARVIENPSCRWSSYACNAAGIDCRRRASVRPGYEACCDPTVPKTVQDRAWSSPIWTATREPGATR